MSHREKLSESKWRLTLKSVYMWVCVCVTGVCSHNVRNRGSCSRPQGPGTHGAETFTFSL